MRLIDPGDTTTALKIEGLSPNDADDDDDRYLGCDASEYHGGDDVDSAQQVRLVQLKYSTKKPATAWTAARLAAKPTKGQPVVARLCAMFGAIRSDYGPDVALSKTTIALVSNQPVAPGLLDALSEAKQELERCRPSYATALLLKRLTSANGEPLRHLWAASGLSSGAFTDFLRVFDLSGCGAGSRQMQALSLITEVGSVLVGNHLPGVLGLRQLVQQQMMPEHDQDPPLQQADVIAALGASGSRSLFPYPSLVELPTHYVSTGQAELLADQLAQSPSRRLIAHGGLGIGKSTTLLNLEARLPAGSVVVTYDCFAQGEYLNPAEDRHSYLACVQLANDLSLRFGLPPLVVPAGPMPDRDLLLGLEGQVRAAAELLAKDACLVLAIDAADNALFAATRRGESCFVEGLWRLRTAPNVRVVMTARTARKNGLRSMVVDLSIDEFSLAAFDADASRLMLLSDYPDAGADLAVAFHRASQGVARVQRYALDSATTAGAAVEQAHLELTAIFDDILETALTGITDPETRRVQLAVLAVMPRPITKTTLAAVLKLGSSEVTDLVDALKPAVVEGVGGLGFADEDFEAYLDKRLSLELRHRANALFAGYMWLRRDTDPEAAQHVAEFLFEANRDSDLIRLARDEPPPEVIADGFIRARTYRTRVRLALQATSRPGELPQPGEALRLIIAAADAATTGTALQDTLREAPELAAVHVDPMAVAEVLASAPDSGDWRGRLHFRAAAILARHPARQDEATEQLELGRAWLRSWLRDNDDHRRGRGPKAADIANAALAAFTLHGAELAWRMATQWRPPSFASEVVSELVEVSPGRIPWAQMSLALDRHGATPLVRARAALGYGKAGDHVPIAFIRAVCRDLSVRPATINALWLPEFSTLALGRGVSRDLIRGILAPRIVEPQYLHDWDAAEKLLPYLRAKVTLALLARPDTDVGDLLPSRLKDEGTPQYSPSRESERRVFYEASRPLLPLVTAEVKIALAAGGKRQGAVARACSQTEATVNAHFQRIANDSQHRFHQTTTTLIASSRLAIDVLIAAAALQRTPADSEQSQHTEMCAALNTMAGAITAAFSDAAPRLLVHVAQGLCKHNLEPDLALSLLHRAADGIQTANIPVNERRDLLLSAAHAAQLASTPGALRHSSDLFDQAVDVAGGLDADLGNRFRTLLHVADIRNGTPTPATQMLAERLLDTLEQAISKVYEPDEELPIKFGLTVASNLNASAGLARSFRWADDDLIALPEALSVSLPSCVRSGALSADQAMSLLHLRDPEASPLILARQLIEQVPDLGAQRAVLEAWLPMLTQAITCDAAFGGSATDAAQLLNMAASRGLSAHPACAQLHDYLHTRLVVDEPAPALPRWKSDRERPPLDREHIIQNANSVTATRDVTALTEDYAPEAAITAYLERLAQTSAQTRVETLSTIARLADVPTVGCHATATAKVLRTLINKWEHNPTVRSWLATDLPDWVARQFFRLFNVESDTDGLWTLRLIIPADTKPVRDRVQQEVCRQLDQLSAPQLHAIACTIAVDVADPTDRIDTVNWALDRQLESRPPTSPSLADLGLDLFATAMLAALAHEDLRYRWLAAHAIRDYVRATSDVDVLRTMLALSAHAEESSLTSFRTFNTLVPALTARMWLLIGMERIALQQPEILTPMLADLVQCASDSAIPHAAIREIARRAARHIDDATHTLDPEQRERLQLANRPRLCALDQRGEAVGGDEARDTKFDFDPMDTVPYWFEPLSRVFDGVTATAVTAMADRWVSDVWRRSWDEDCKYDPRALRRRDSYSLTQNDHGRLPMIETAQNYLEYHAMHLVAGELIDKKPIVHRYRDDPSDPWHDWLDGYLPAPEGWLADARSPAPGHPLVLGHWSEVPDGNQRGEVNERPDLEHLAVTVNGSLSKLTRTAEMIVVAASVDTRCDKIQFNGYIRSALINPESIASFRSALRLINFNPNLPTARDNDNRGFWSNSIHLSGLLLRGWLTDPREFESLDRFDPLWAANAPRPLTLQDGAESTTIEWSSRDFQLPIRHQEQDSTNGCLTEARGASLRAELARLGLSLLLQYDTRVYPVDNEATGGRTHREACRYRVIHANGTEEELDAFTDTYNADF